MLVGSWLGLGWDWGPEHPHLAFHWVRTSSQHAEFQRQVSREGEGGRDKEIDEGKEGEAPLGRIYTVFYDLALKLMQHHLLPCPTAQGGYRGSSSSRRWNRNPVSGWRDVKILWDGIHIGEVIFEKCNLPHYLPDPPLPTYLCISFYSLIHILHFHTDLFCLFFLWTWQTFPCLSTFVYAVPCVWSVLPSLC